MDNIEKNQHSQKLLRCSVVNKNGKTSQRFVEFDSFKLWNYMMHHKHGLHIRDISLWLWMPGDTHSNRQTVLSGSSDILKVNRLEVFLFDAQNDFSHTFFRYVNQHEAAQVEQILLGHLSPKILAACDYQVQTTVGNCINHKIRNGDTLLLGLSHGDERLWYRER